MMKKKILMVVGMILAVAVCHGAGAKAVTASVQEMARYGCTHVIEWSHDNLSGTTTNATLVFTNTFTAPVSVKFEGYILDAPFDAQTPTNALGGLAVSVGVTGTTTKWISALQVARDRTPTIYSSFGTDYTVATTTIGPNTNALVSTSTVTSPRVNAQTANVSVVTTFAMTGTVQTMDALNSGRLRTFWRVLGPKYE
jgi:hypothetical protein